jgi:DNA-binding response OmpR family regulator
MSETTRALRLDEILLREGLVTEAQLSAALQRQKLYGGRLGTQLLQMQFIDEAALIGVLAKKLGCDGIVLSHQEIPESIVNMVPATVAVARKVMPFAYDATANVLGIACEDPSNPDLINELKFVSAGKTVKLYVAAELALNVAIARYYLGRDGTPEYGSGITDVSGNPLSGSGGLAVGESKQSRGSILLVTDDAASGIQLQTMFERDRFKVVRTDSADDAIQIIGNHKFHSVFIQDTVSGDYIDLIDRLRKISPKTRVRYYESAASLLLSLDAGVLESELLIKNLELFTSLLSSTGGSTNNHSARVGQYVEKLCIRLELADKDRLVITNAAYLHDLAKFYYGNTGQATDHRSHIDLTVKLLNSLNYSPLVIEILRSMYINLREKFTKRLPIEVLGGNILTVTDIFCETIRTNVTLSLDKFDAIKRKYRELIGKLFLAEVVEAFIAMIQEEILSITQLEKYSQVMLYGVDKDQVDSIELRIKSAGFRTVAEQNFDTFVELFKRSRPDIVILLECGGADQVNRLVENLLQRNVAIDRVPTFLLTEGSLATQMSVLLEEGLEDVIPADDNLNLLLIKMKKIQARIEAKAKEREEVVQQSGAVGHLEDMNLIDLLQALGPSRKTAKLIINAGQKKLVVFLNQGDIIYAESGEKTGAEAVYEGISWTSGTWNIQPVTPQNLPEPNNFYSNESIMMEGCRLLDESGRIQIPTSNPS